ncbi:hypothetical protein SFC65_19035 [Priestia filamentosa]|uniref:hypothetical protein n=1 Tax=Priestia filamentosa TaxID=1402861 RepID=UPI0039820E65
MNEGTKEHFYTMIKQLDAEIKDLKRWKKHKDRETIKKVALPSALTVTMSLLNAVGLAYNIYHHNTTDTIFGIFMVSLAIYVLKGTFEDIEKVQKDIKERKQMVKDKISLRASYAEELQK